MIDLFNDFTGDKDLGKIRTIELENNKINLKCEDPHGFWTVHFERGQMPEDLKGWYTTFDLAEKAVMAYLQRKKRVLKTT